MGLSIACISRRRRSAVIFACSRCALSTLNCFIREIVVWRTFGLQHRAAERVTRREYPIVLFVIVYVLQVPYGTLLVGCYSFLPIRFFFFLSLQHMVGIVTDTLDDDAMMFCVSFGRTESESLCVVDSCLGCVKLVVDPSRIHYYVCHV